MPFWRMKLEDVTLDQLYEFLERGNIKDAPQHIVDYLMLIEKIRGMIYRKDIYGNKESVIKHLKLVDGLSDYKANKVYYETIEYFHVDIKVSKEAWRNYYADIADKALTFSLLKMQDTRDGIAVVKGAKEVADLRGAFDPEPEEIPDNFFMNTVNLLSLDANIFEFGKANRQALEEMIDGYPQVTEKEKIRIKQETLILPLKIFPDESENPRKS